MRAESKQWGGNTTAWLFLLLAVALIAPASLFVHDFMLESLKVPYPKTVDLPSSIRFLNNLVRFIALAGVCVLARPRCAGISRVTAALTAGLLLAMLNETFRVLLIETAIVQSGAYSVLDIAPKALSSLLGGCAVAWIAFGSKERRNAVLGIVLVAAIVTFAIRPGLEALCASLKNSLPEPTPLFSDPYPTRINVLIYATFVEPTIAAFAMAAACWPALRGRRGRRILAFTVLLLLVRGRFVELFVEAYWVKQPLPIAFLAESQFFLETLTLGLLVALAWSYSLKIRDVPDASGS
jgi:VanZ family protein